MNNTGWTGSRRWAAAPNEPVADEIVKFTGIAAGSRELTPSRLEDYLTESSSNLLLQAYSWRRHDASELPFAGAVDIADRELRETLRARISALDSAKNDGEIVLPNEYDPSTGVHPFDLMTGAALSADTKTVKACTARQIGTVKLIRASDNDDDKPTGDVALTISGSVPRLRHHYAIPVSLPLQTVLYQTPFRSKRLNDRIKWTCRTKTPNRTRF